MEIVAPTTAQLDELCDLAGKIFGKPDYFEFARFCRESYIPDSCYDWSASRVALDQGRIVAHVGVWGYDMRVGRALLRTGGIGLVMTHYDYRKQGVAAEVFNASLSAMREAGYVHSLLFGIQNYYDRFGYAQAWPGIAHACDVSALPQEKQRYKLVQTATTEALCGRGAVMRLYERENATRTGTAVRPVYRRAAVTGWRSKFNLHALQSKGQTKGYVIWHVRPDDIEVIEAGGFTAPAVGPEQLMLAAGELARQSGRQRISLRALGLSHPLCQYLRGRDCHVNQQCSRAGGAMCAAVDLAGCLAAMEGELTDRLSNSVLRTFSGALNIDGLDQSASLVLRNGKARLDRSGARSGHRIVAGAAAARLVLGSASPDELAVQAGVKYGGRGLELARVLFPAQWPMLYTLDSF